MRQGRKAASRSEPSSLQDLINNLFSYPYTKVEFIQNVLKVPPRSGPGSSNKRGQVQNRLLIGPWAERNCCE